MPRMMRLEAESAYRAVILKRFPGVHSHKLYTYTMADGSTIDYHFADVYGPYSAKRQAKASLTRETSYLTRGTYFNGTLTVPEFDAFVECTEPVWTKA